MIYYASLVCYHDAGQSSDWIKDWNMVFWTHMSRQENALPCTVQLESHLIDVCLLATQKLLSICFIMDDDTAFLRV